MSPNDEQAQAAVPVTVVIPTFNRAADLERCLAHLGRQSIGVLCVVVVDNSSSRPETQFFNTLINPPLLTACPGV